MKSWENEEFSEKYWSSSGPSFNLMQEDDKRKYNLENVNKFSMRSSKAAPMPPSSSNLKSYQNVEPLSFSIKAETDLQCPELLCHTCQKIIVDHDACKYEGNKVFTNEICWKHWIDKMAENGDIQVVHLCSSASKQYFLERVSATCNGQLILKVILALKGAMQEFEFGSLLCINPMAYDHYISFLRETHQSDDKLLRCKYEIEEVMTKLRDIFSTNSNVGESTVNNFMSMLSEFRDERLLTPKTFLQSEMIKEYIALLSWQSTNNKEFINAPLIETLTTNNVSFKAIKDTTKAKYLKDTYKLTPEEFVWTSMRPIVEENKFNEIDSIFNHKIMGTKPNVSMQRIVAYLVFLNKEPNEIKMKCLSKISNIEELVECANTWRLLPAYTEYLKQNKDNSQLKKIQQLVQSYKK